MTTEVAVELPLAGRSILVVEDIVIFLVAAAANVAGRMFFAAALEARWPTGTANMTKNTKNAGMPSSAADARSMAAASPDAPQARPGLQPHMQTDAPVARPGPE
jgi:hypothetical protein